MTIKPSHVLITHIVELIGLLLDGSEAMFGLKDLEHRYIYTNHELDTSFGVEPGGLIGKTIEDIASDVDAKAFRDKEKAVMESGEPARFFERFQVGGKIIDCATIRFPFRDESGEIVGVGFVALNHIGRNLDSFETHSALEKAQQKIFDLQTLQEKMQLQARTDVLTGVWNRRQIEENMRLELARLDRYNHPFSIVFMDLDHFKRINDTWGHNLGDRILKEFCQVISNSMRNTDMLGRWGGEEFILLLPNTGRVSARLVAERLRTSVEQHVFSDVGSVTASFGVATGRAKESMAELVERADAALYVAKHGGRNRVESDAIGKDADSEFEHVGASFVRLVWRPAYECGHELIDRQHRILFEDSNQLLDAVINNHPKEEIARLIDVLLKDVVQHFEDEEAIFKDAGYPQAEEHCRAHADLVAKALDLSVRYAADKLTLGELFGFLANEVVAKHLLADDRKFFSYLGNTAW